mmetsp:Transcript_51173/g.61602  ORF Transcript_51173/g.61602 Transcript_51173/m.61602 type:complete len:100 (+) Transcript_51173:411-710(+)
MIRTIGFWNVGVQKFGIFSPMVKIFERENPNLYIRQYAKRFVFLVLHHFVGVCFFFVSVEWFLVKLTKNTQTRPMKYDPKNDKNSPSEMLSLYSICCAI